MTDQFVNKVLKDFRHGRLSLSEAANQLLSEMSRCNRILVVDENLFGLDDELYKLGYVVNTLIPRYPDELIKLKLRNKVFITRNGRDFDKDLKKHHYGLIWVKRNLPYPEMARAIMAILMKAGFKNNLLQIKTL